VHAPNDDLVTQSPSPALVGAKRAASYPEFQSFYQLLEIQSRVLVHSSAILAPNRAPLSYSRLREQADYVAAILNSTGVGRNDRVALVLPNGPELAVAYASVVSCATVAPLNPSSSYDEFLFYLSNIDCGALITSAEFQSPAVDVARAHNVPILELFPAWEDAAGLFTLKPHGSKTRAAKLSAGAAHSDDVAMVLHTSGTTARPKLIPVLQTSLCGSARDICVSIGLDEHDLCLNVMPLIHGHGIMSSLCATLVGGAGVICLNRFEPTSFFECLAAFRPTWYTAAPAIHQAILRHVDDYRKIVEECSLRFIRSASAPLSPRVLLDLEQSFHAPVIEYYGMTEACSQITSNPLPPGTRKIGSVGISTGSEIGIMDEGENLMSAGNRGEIVVRGRNVMRGYEKAPDANIEAFCNGWLRTGDEGYLDEDGYLFLTGRAKEVINRGGRKVSPREIDDALLEHPDVMQAVAFARPHATLGEDVVMAVVLRPDRTSSESDLRRFLLQKLAEYKVPTQILIVDEIPKSGTGKTSRRGLHDKFQSKLKSKFVGPHNDTQVVLAAIWKHVLGIDTVGINDNFFDLGGDSLRIAEVHSKLQDAFRTTLPITALFEHSTIKSLAEHIDRSNIDGPSIDDRRPDKERIRRGYQRLQRQRQFQQPTHPKV
jgi:acyl-CoA synthetase (AMP-forming)/AMP-acid ligase II/acyl carrier protein